MQSDHSVRETCHKKRAYKQSARPPYSVKSNCFIFPFCTFLNKSPMLTFQSVDLYTASSKYCKM